MHRVKYLIWHLYLVADFFISANLIKLFSRSGINQRRLLSRNTRRISRQFLKAFQLSVDVIHPERLDALKSQNYLAISNHVSYTDIILLASLEDFVFITSVEMGNNPFLGQITRLGGCLYTNRKRFVSLPKEIERFASAIKEGFKVMLFPEGTSTNGDSIKAFRSSLFQTAILANCPILPICVSYKSIDNQPITTENRDLLYWYGEMTFTPHFMKLLGRPLVAEVEILEPIFPQQFKSRQDITEQVYSLIHDCYHNKKPDSHIMVDNLLT